MNCPWMDCSGIPDTRAKWGNGLEIPGHGFEQNNHPPQNEKEDRDELAKIVRSKMVETNFGFAPNCGEGNNGH